MAFSDKTSAMATLNYTFQPPSGTPYALNLVNVPVANMGVGDSRVIEADALYASGPIDVTQAAIYKVRSGSENVFSVSASGGTIAAIGNDHSPEPGHCQRRGVATGVLLLAQGHLLAEYRSRCRLRLFHP